MTLLILFMAHVIVGLEFSSTLLRIMEENSDRFSAALRRAKRHKSSHQDEIRR